MEIRKCSSFFYMICIVAFFIILKRCFKNYRHWFRNHAPIYIAHVSLKFLAETRREQTSLWFWKMTMIRKTWADDSQILSLCYLLKMLAFIFFPLMKLKSTSWLLILLYCSFSYDTSRVYMWNTSVDTNLLLLLDWIEYQNAFYL